MKSIILSLFIATFVLASSGDGDSSQLRLELTSPDGELRLGQSTSLELKIIGGAIHDIIRDSEGIDPQITGLGAFVYRFRIEPQREGSFDFGPYSLSVNGRHLVSNEVSIRVLPPWDGVTGTFFRVDKDVIVQGEDFRLTAETWSEDYKRLSLGLVRDDSFSGKSGRSSFQRVSGQAGTVTYEKRTWLITPKNPGEFPVSEDLFKEFPEDLKPPDFIVTVEESPPAQESDGAVGD